MAQEGTIIHDCTYLGTNYKKGTIVYKFRCYTYGVIKEGSIAVSLEYGKHPFFELPPYVVKWRTMVPCAVCSQLPTKTWVNPANHKNKCDYCEEHYASISKCFGNFSKLVDKVTEEDKKREELITFFKDLGWTYPKLVEAYRRLLSFSQRLLRRLWLIEQMEGHTCMCSIYGIEYNRDTEEPANTVPYLFCIIEGEARTCSYVKPSAGMLAIAKGLREKKNGRRESKETN